MATLKASHIVKPADPTPNEIMPLSECDQVTALTHAPTIYIYKPTTNILLKDAMHILKDALSKALVLFYPLAGRLHSVDGGRVELHCNSMGALLLEAESDARIEDFGESFTPNEQFRALLPEVDLISGPLHEVPLLLGQLTKFACGGLSLGLMISHMVVDGMSALHFIAEWAKIARGEKPDDLPFLDRRVLQPWAVPKAEVEYSMFNPPPLLIGHSDNREERQKPVSTAVLKLSKDQIEKLKNMANRDPHPIVHNNGSQHPFSTFEAVSAHVWRCACKARRHASNQETAFYVTIGLRKILERQLPPRYFGNLVLRAPAKATAGDLLTRPLSYAASKIRTTKEMVTDEYVNSYLLKIKNLPDVSVFRTFHTVGCSQGTFYGNPNISVVSWQGLPVYGADFGWGKEIFMGPGRLGFDGKAFLLPSPKGDGSLLLPLCLQKEHMEAFEKYFYEKICTSG